MKSKVITVSSILAILSICILAVMCIIMSTGAFSVSVDTSKLVFSSASGTFIYDGQSHNLQEWKLEEGKLREGHRAEVTAVASAVNVGSIPNTITAKIVDEKGNDVSSYYTIEYAPGLLTIAPRPITITTGSATKIYDGLPLENVDFWITSQYNLAEGHSIQTIIMNASLVDVGTARNAVTSIIITDGKQDVTPNYQITYIEGSLNITPRDITVRSASAEKVFDDTPLTANEYTIEVGSLANNHKINVVITGSRTQVGESPNRISKIEITDIEGRDVSYNYNISFEQGTLVILPVDGGDGGEGGDGGDGETGGGETGGGETGGGETGGEDGNGDMDLGLSEDNVDNMLNNKNPVFKVFSDENGYGYMRLKSMGDYTGQGWQAANAYPILIDGKYSPNYLTGIALEKAGYKSTVIKVDNKGASYYLPYYLDTDQLNYQIQTSDVFYSGDNSGIYSMYSFMYDYTTQGKVVIDLGIYAEYELKYRQYVYDTYLQIPATTLEFMNTLIQQNGFDKNSPTIVADVVNYIKNAASYSLYYDRQLDNTSDIVISFLRDYKQGVCQHYASAATMMFRALGIPARYTVGYAAQLSSGQWANVYNLNAHAWTEVYIDGMGWVQVDATGSGEWQGPPPEGGEGDVELPTSLVIKPIDISMQYDGVTTLTHSGELQGLNIFLENGYTYYAYVSGSIRNVGFATATITDFSLYDPDGKDVTEEFEIQFKEGKLHVYLSELTISTGSAEKVYDGKPLKNSECAIEGSLLAGHQLSLLKTTGEQTNVGVSVNFYELAIYDQEGQDVTYMYKINSVYGILKVLAREITVQSADAEKNFDNQALTNAKYTLSSIYENALAEGHKIVVNITGSQTAVGSSTNTISSIIILDENNKDVTQNYAIHVIEGILKVLPPQS